MANASTQTDSVVSLAKSKVGRGTHSTRLHRNSKVASSGKVGQYKAGCPWLRVALFDTALFKKMNILFE